MNTKTLIIAMVATLVVGIIAIIAVAILTYEPSGYEENGYYYDQPPYEGEQNTTPSITTPENTPDGVDFAFLGRWQMIEHSEQEIDELVTWIEFMTDGMHATWTAGPGYEDYYRTEAAYFPWNITSDGRLEMILDGDIVEVVVDGDVMSIYVDETTIRFARAQAGADAENDINDDENSDEDDQE